MAKAFQNKLLAVKIGLLEKQRSNLETVASATDKVLSLANDWTRNADAGSDATFKDLNCMIEDMILYLGDKYTELPAFCANASDSTGGLFGGGSQVNTGGLFGGTSQVNTGGLFGGTSQVNTGRIFGEASQGNTGSLFGADNLFGVANQANTGSLFGGASQANTGRLFGGTSQANTGGPFGGTSQANTDSLFGGTSQVNTGRLFGGTSQANTGGPFGGASQGNTGSLFGGASQGNTGSLFGGASQVNTGGLFGGAIHANTGGLFSGASHANTGGLFGGASQANTGGLFGGASQGNTGGLFGGARQTNTGIGSLFSTSAARTGFGAKPGSFAVFRTPTGQIGSNPFGTCTRASTSQFGQPHAIGWVSAVEGTPIPLDPPYGQDVCVKNGVKIDVNTKHQCITAMMEYGNKSLEELRLEDYNIDQKSKQSMGLFGQTPSTQVTTGFSTGDGPGECLCAACQRGNSRWNKNASSIIYTSTVSFGSELTGIKEFNTKKNETICCPIMNLEKVNKQKKKKKNLKKMYVQTKKKISNKMQQKQPKKEKHFEKSQCLDNYLHKALQTATRIAKKAHIGLKDNNHLMQKKIAEQKETNDDHEKQLEEINVALDNILESIQVLTTRVGLLESKVVDNKQFSDVHTKCEILQENSENVQCNLDDPDTQFQELASKADEASKNLMPIPELKNLQNAEDKINAFQEEWKKSKQEVGKLHNDFEIENPRGEDPDFSPSSGENCDF
ncbi:hypothetical protein BsWGS_23377 [Bradybaena similaris]